MKNTFLFTTLIAGLALTGCNKTTRTDTATTTTPAGDPVVTTTPTTTDTVGAKIDRAGDRVADATRNAADNVRAASREVAADMREAGRDIKARMTEWRLSASEIEADVNANRPIVRTRTDAVTTAKIDDDTLENSIKGRLHADPMFADLKFDVNANNKGEVELEGKARTTDQIAHAMATALSHDGVTKVTSKIKLDPDAGPNRR
jgi:osmotically-inducible protein OsmY